MNNSLVSGLEIKNQDLPTSSQQAFLPTSIIYRYVFGFISTQSLYAALEIDLFSILAQKPLTTKEIVQKCELHERGAQDFLDLLVSMEVLKCEGEGENRIYMNTPVATQSFIRSTEGEFSPYMTLYSKIYTTFNSLVKGLKTGRPQTHMEDGEDYFDVVAKDEAAYKEFAQAMTAQSWACVTQLVEVFDFGKYTSMCDVGGSEGLACMLVAKKYPHVKCKNAELLHLNDISNKYFQKHGVSDNAEFVELDFFKEELPSADVFVLGHILHDHSLAKKKLLLQKAFCALPSGGACIVYEFFIDEERKKNMAGLQMSLVMLLVTVEGFDYTYSDIKGWMLEKGFVNIEYKQLGEVQGCAIGYKP